MDVALVFCGGMVITFLLRSAFFWRQRPGAASPMVRVFLSHIPTAAFTTLVISLGMVADGVIRLNSHHLLALLLAGILAFYVRYTWVPLLIGMLSLWLLKAIWSPIVWLPFS